MGCKSEKKSDRREGKGHRCWLRALPEFRTSHLVARMIWRYVFGRTSILRGRRFGGVWARWSSIFLKYSFFKCSFFYSSFSSNHTGAKCLGQHWMESIPFSHSHLAARMFWRKGFVRTSILEGWWFGVVGTGWSSIFPKHHSVKCSFFYSSFSSNHPGAKSL